MTGLSGVLGRLASLPGSLQEASLRAAQTAAQEAAAQARSMAPVRTGALRASIAAAPAPRGAQAAASCPYAAIVELGSLRSAAQPYLLPGALAVDYAGLCGQALREAML